jgi:hypothetical protein
VYYPLLRLESLFGGVWERERKKVAGEITKGATFKGVFNVEIRHFCKRIKKVFFQRVASEREKVFASLCDATE